MTLKIRIIKDTFILHKFISCNWVLRFNIRIYETGISSNHKIFMPRNICQILHSNAKNIWPTNCYSRFISRTKYEENYFKISHISWSMLKLNCVEKIFEMLIDFKTEFPCRISSFFTKQTLNWRVRYLNKKQCDVLSCSI